MGNRNVSNDGFDLSLVGSLTDIGPLDALIEFTEPVKLGFLFVFMNKYSSSYC
jgi:hypothetical protein